MLTLRLNPTSCDIPRPKDEGVQLDEDDSQEVSPAECIAEQHIVNAWRRTQEQQVRKELMAQEVEEEGASMSKQMSKQTSMQIDVNISDIQGPLRTIKAERSWLVADIKKILERTEKIHRGRQRLLLGDGDVDDLQPLMNLAQNGPLNFVLVVCMDPCSTYLLVKLCCCRSLCPLPYQADVKRVRELLAL